MRRNLPQQTQCPRLGRMSMLVFACQRQRPLRNRVRILHSVGERQGLAEPDDVLRMPDAAAERPFIGCRGLLEEGDTLRAASRSRARVPRSTRNKSADKGKIPLATKAVGLFEDARRLHQVPAHDVGHAKTPAVGLPIRVVRHLGDVDALPSARDGLGKFAAFGKKPSKIARAMAAGSPCRPKRSPRRSPSSMRIVLVRCTCAWSNSPKPRHAAPK